MIDSYSRPRYIKSYDELVQNIQLGISTESIYMDFKLDVSSDLKSPKKKSEIAEEIALDICQFANTWGGVLLIGIKESSSGINGLKVVQEFIGLTNFEEFSQFVNDSVLPLIYPKHIKIDLRPVQLLNLRTIGAVNVLPLDDGIACVCMTTPPYSPKYPYRTHYGKKYLHPLEVEKRMSYSTRSIAIRLDDLIQLTREVTIYPNIEREPIDKPEMWDSSHANVFLKDISSYEFSLKVSGIDINIPFSLVKDVWYTEKNTIGLLLSIRLVVSSDRKSISLGL